MVDDAGKVLDIKRDMPNDPAKSRAAWEETRLASVKEAAKQHATQ